MEKLKKYRLEIIVSTLIIIAYFLLRLYHLMSLPMFTDEAIYTRWSQIARFDANWRFISLTDGKQPLLIWLDMTLMRIIHDPLMAGRLVSVFSGFATSLGLFFLGKELFRNRWVGILSSFLYLIYPFALVYDRMALYDSLVGSFVVWSLYFQVLLVRYLRLDLALILGMVIGGGVLTKSSGFFSIYLLPFSLILFNWRIKDRFTRFIKWLGLAILSAVLAYSYYSVLRLSPFFHIINEKNTLFVYPLHDWLSHPFTFFVGNLGGVWDWFITYLTWPIFLLLVTSLFVALKYTREKLVLIIWFLAPSVALALFGRVLYPRFIFFMTLSLLPLVALALYEVFKFFRSKKLFTIYLGFAPSFAYLLFTIFLILPIRSDYFILNDFKKAPIPYSDLEQYINSWPAGGGINQILTYLNKESKKGKIYVASLGTFGSLPTYSVEIYLGENKNVDKRGIYPVPSTIPKDLIEKSKTMPVFIFVSNQREFEESIKTWPLKLIVQYKKGIGNSYSKLFIVESK